MLRRLIAVVVVLALVGVGLYAWRRAASPRPAAVSAAGVVSEVRGFGAEAREKLAEVGHGLHDVKLKAAVKTALALNRGLRPYSIDVSSEDGVITLRGRVNGGEERARAETLASAVPEVLRVVNQMQVLAGPTPVSGRTLGESLDDETLEIRVRLALSLNRELRSLDLTVQAYRREVTLGGEVGSLAQRELALETARDTTAIAGVVDRIRVRTAATPVGVSASERAAAAQGAVHASPHLTTFDLQVREEGGRLVLRGAVRTPIEKDLALVLAREAAGGGVDDAVEVRAGG